MHAPPLSCVQDDETALRHSSISSPQLNQQGCCATAAKRRKWILSITVCGRAHVQQSLRNEKLTLGSPVCLPSTPAVLYGLLWSWWHFGESWTHIGPLSCTNRVINIHNRVQRAVQFSLAASATTLALTPRVSHWQCNIRWSCMWWSCWIGAGWPPR